MCAFGFFRHLWIDCLIIILNVLQLGNQKDIRKISCKRFEVWQDLTNKMTNWMAVICDNIKECQYMFVKQ